MFLQSRPYSFTDLTMLPLTDNWTSAASISCVNTVVNAGVGASLWKGALCQPAVWTWKRGMPDYQGASACLGVRMTPPPRRTTNRGDEDKPRLWPHRHISNMKWLRIRAEE
ncbi:unnamed protein product [Fusarium graminearum]|uniref:Chromosome 1, complete genome n=2 Tax=Gibberella zeae TaxID=5518 RepID=I1S5E2_GIBZE|nr:hypothetical protein FGSG_12060 [Fusarium graminearum PH-1]CAF3450701.1 unnamed protein product [Fusarium graminearum]ESU07403.1 hypothetical protein FGSG_12060 [Fusarium graminearum PH-1]CAF3609713.1 unnamed protein product [Fusarium graminearum]CAG1968859.1 unnamed protein product [Fusarium graminearum]CAG1979255.1 unnamed protein product [Fusarium graminearum]|eukprot:XP_011317888.1 hypothetical protein FGSG_12060 [Fusarium graminearum PH-1]